MYICTEQSTFTTFWFRINSAFLCAVATGGCIDINSQNIDIISFLKISTYIAVSIFLAQQYYSLVAQLSVSTAILLGNQSTMACCCC